MAIWRRKLIGAPAAVRSWLTDPSSLTRRLRAGCANFCVNGVSQRNRPVLADEVRYSRVAATHAARIREVWLNCADTPLVYAHSVLPHGSLAGSWKALARLGDRPLGAALFADVRVRRIRLQFCRLPAHHPLSVRAAAHGGFSQRLWARRSLFERDGRRILVTEVFMPEVLR